MRLRYAAVLMIGMAGCKKDRMIIVVQKPLPHTCVSRAIYVYDGSTSKFLPVYADSEMTTPMANPLFIGCDGEDYTFWTSGNARVVAKDRP